MEILIHSWEISIPFGRFGNSKENRMFPSSIIVREVFVQPIEMSVHFREISFYLMEILLHFREISISFRTIFDYFKEYRMRPCPIIVRVVFDGPMEISIHFREITILPMDMSIHFREI